VKDSINNDQLNARHTHTHTPDDIKLTAKLVPMTKCCKIAVVLNTWWWISTLAHRF